MRLRPSIASYSGEIAARMRAFLTDPVLGTIASVARAPVAAGEIAPAVLGELTEMHVLREEAGMVRLQTAVFLEQDITRVVREAALLAGEAAALVAEHGGGFGDAAPEVTCFLGGVIAIQQGLGLVLERRGLAGAWKAYQGRYARSKVDFDEDCPAYAALGADLQNKSVFRGERYSAVSIGPERPGFLTLAYAGDPPERSRRYLREINCRLVDDYARLLLGEVCDRHLAAAAEMAGFLEDGRPRTSVVTGGIVDRYAPDIGRLTGVVSGFYLDRIPALAELLATTAAGRQGVPASDQMMHLWRYIRRATAKELYAVGFLRDTVPRDGSLTVFVENGNPMLAGMI